MLRDRGAATSPYAPRRLMVEAYERLRSGDNLVVVVAPTSYGKTAASPWIWRRAVEDGLAGGLVHVVPLRSLVRDAFNNFFKPYGGRLQAHGVEEDLKSPYFLSDLVVTTLDSFFWNLYKLPVAEAVKVMKGLSMGHYYPALTSILTSLVVFDEAHMYLWEGGDSKTYTVEAMLAAATGLVCAGVPVIIETATLRPSSLHSLLRSLHEHRLRTSIVALKAPSREAGSAYLSSLKKGPAELIMVCDEDWEEEKLVRWETNIKETWEEAVKSIVEDAQRGLPVLVVANTVKEVVELYKKLREKVDDVVLLHGRVGERERSKREELIKKLSDGKGGVVVATQVVEAGVDVNAAAVYTAAAPIENLAQRAGRACRRGKVLEACREGEAARFIIVSGASCGPYDEGVVKLSLSCVQEERSKGKEIDWRATCDHEGYVSYASLVARVDERVEGQHVDKGLVELFTKYLCGDARPWTLLELLDTLKVCSLVRGSIMVEVSAGDDVVTASLDWVLRHAKEVLEFHDDSPLLRVVFEDHSVVEGAAERLWRLWRSTGGEASCRSLFTSLLRDVERIAGRDSARKIQMSLQFVAKEEAYDRDLGLLLPSERSLQRR